MKSDSPQSRGEPCQPLCRHRPRGQCGTASVVARCNSRCVAADEWQRSDVGFVVLSPYARACRIRFTSSRLFENRNDVLRSMQHANDFDAARLQRTIENQILGEIGEREKSDTFQSWIDPLPPRAEFRIGREQFKDPEQGAPNSVSRVDIVDRDILPDVSRMS